MQEVQVQFLGQEDSLKEEMATHSSILAWRIPQTEEPCRLSPWGPKESDTTDHARSHWTSASAIPLACDGLLPSCPAVSFTSYPGFSLFLPPGCLP